MQELRQFEQINFGGISLSGSNPVCDQARKSARIGRSLRNACESAHKTLHRVAIPKPEKTVALILLRSP